MSLGRRHKLNSPCCFQRVNSRGETAESMQKQAGSVRSLLQYLKIGWVASTVTVLLTRLNSCFPLTDVAMAESLAGSGELVVSPSVHEVLQKRQSTSIASELVFTHMEEDFQRVSWPNCPPGDKMLLHLKENGDMMNDLESPDAQSLIDKLIDTTHAPTSLSSENSLSQCSLRSDLMCLLENHRHEAARDVVGQFSAELRRVVVLFISIMYEPSLPQSQRQDSKMLEKFQTIFTTISDIISSRLGQVRQFINDDKGTVLIASFGLRGSVQLHPSDTAVEAGKEAQKVLLEEMDIQCSIGITSGKIFCGETGSFQRYEYSLLGPSVNLAARLMAKGTWGQINCDKELKSQTSRRHIFTISGTHKLKGYETPVDFFMPVQDCETTKKDDEQDDVVTFHANRKEVLELVDGIIQNRKAHVEGSGSQRNSGTHIQPRMILIHCAKGKEKESYISGILMQPAIRNSSLVMEANLCYHDDPFYCFIPIISRILLSFPRSRNRLISFQRQHKRKRSSIFSSLLANDVLQEKAFSPETNMVPDALEPYLSLINGFVFKGYPLLKSSPEVTQLKDDAKVEKCIEVLSALIIQYLKITGKPGIIAIPEIDSIDTCSKKLLRLLLKTDVDLLIIGGADDNVSLEDVPHSFLASILDNNLNVNVETHHLELLDLQTSFDLFRWCLRRDFSQEDLDTINHSEVHDKVLQLCGGMAHATARLARTFCTQHQKDKAEVHGDLFMLYLHKFLNDTPATIEEIICFRFDQMKYEEQMLLKIASVAGFDQYR